MVLVLDTYCLVRGIQVGVCGSEIELWDDAALYSRSCRFLDAQKHRVKKGRFACMCPGKNVC